MPDKKIIGARLRELRGERTILQVASDCGISDAALGMYEKGQRTPRDNIKIVLARYYKRSVQSLFFE